VSQDHPGDIASALEMCADFAVNVQGVSSKEAKNLQILCWRHDLEKGTE